MKPTYPRLKCELIRLDLSSISSMLFCCFWTTSWRSSSSSFSSLAASLNSSNCPKKKKIDQREREREREREISICILKSVWYCNWNQKKSLPNVTHFIVTDHQLNWPNHYSQSCRTFPSATHEHKICFQLHRFELTLYIRNTKQPHSKYYPGQKKSLQPRYSWDWSAVKSCDIMRHRLRSATRVRDAQTPRVASMSNRSLISHDITWPNCRSTSWISRLWRFFWPG